MNEGRWIKIPDKTRHVWFNLPNMVCLVLDPPWAECKSWKITIEGRKTLDIGFFATEQLALDWIKENFGIEV